MLQEPKLCCQPGRPGEISLKLTLANMLVDSD
jgi:hypothetical protein